MFDNLLVQELFHGLFALPFAYIIYKKTDSKRRAMSVIVLSYLVDVDHLVDYFAFYGWKFNITDFLAADYFNYSNRAYVFFHAWEWAIILLVISCLKGWRSIYTLLVSALLPHLIFDSITVGSMVFYSIIYRASNGFGV